MQIFKTSFKKIFFFLCLENFFFHRGNKKFNSVKFLEIPPLANNFPIDYLAKKILKLEKLRQRGRR